MASSDSFPPSRVHAMFWEPQNPLRLTLVEPSADEANGGGVAVYPLLAESGVSCYEHENTALMNILIAHEEHFQNETTTMTKSLKDLSQQYRAAVKDCLLKWNAENAEKWKLREKDSSVQEECTAVELLREVYKIMHLSEIYLPLISPSFSENGDPFDIPGYVTAETVRFLRCHLIEPADFIDPAVPAMIDSEYPEQFQGGLYWLFMQKLVLHGRLESACRLVEAHSVYRSIMEAEETGQGSRESAAWFRELQVVLLRAPLPGGRTGNFDDGLDNEQMLYEDGPEEIEDDGTFDGMASDYKYWEVTGGNLSVDTGDYPLFFSAAAAAQTYHKWKEQVQQVRRRSRLMSRMPELDGVLALLEGDFSNVTFDSWAEQFLAELLYTTPELRPRNMSERASALMRRYGAEKNAENLSALRIMEGSAGEAIFQVYIQGGSSGAALPATLVSLYVSLFMEYGILPQEPELVDLKVRSLLDATSAIVASHAYTVPDIGVQFGIRLLIPYATHEGHSEVLAMIASVLHHYYPSSDQYARTMISICTPLVKRRSLQVLEGCTSILLCLFRQHMKAGNGGVGAMILLDGIELEALVLAPRELGACYRALAAQCHSASLHLLQSIVESTHGNIILDPSVCFTAQSMKQAFENHAVETENIPEAKQLVLVLGIFESMVGQGNFSFQTGNQIVACLETSNDKETGVCTASSSLSLHWLLLQVAAFVLTEKSSEPIVATDKQQFTAAAFDKHGVTLLLQTLDRLRASLPSLSSEELGKMTKLFALALAQAFESENAKKRFAHQFESWDQKSDIDEIRSANLHKYDSGKQERVVQAMLDF